MRLGGAISGWTSPEEWVEAVRGEAYSAAFCPVGLDADEDTVRAYALAAREADIIIAEVGAWGPIRSAPTPKWRGPAWKGAVGRWSWPIASARSAPSTSRAAGARSGMARTPMISPRTPLR